MIAELDKDGSGQIEFEEFFYMMTTRPSDNESRDEVHKVFITFDSQKTGKSLVIQDSSLWKISERLQRIWENSLTIMFSKKWSRELMLISMEWSLRRNSTTSSPRRPHDHDCSAWALFLSYIYRGTTEDTLIKVFIFATIKIIGTEEI